MKQPNRKIETLPLLCVKEAADILGTSEALVYGLLGSRELRGTRVGAGGRIWRTSHEWIQEYLDRPGQRIPPTDVLLIEDNVADYVIVKEITEEVFGKQVRLQPYTDARKALDDLLACRVRPDLIIIDLSLPGMTGMDFLQEMKKARSEGRRAPEDQRPIVVYSSTYNEGDFQKALALCADACYVKEPGFEASKNKIQHMLETFTTGVRAA